MDKIHQIYKEVCDLRPQSLKDMVKERLDLILNNYIEELDQAEKNILKESKYKLYREISKSKWIQY